MATDDRVRIDPATVEALHATHAADLRAFLIGVLRDPDLAQEALQASFGKLLEQGHTAQNETLKSWMFRVAYHEAILLRRRQQVRQKSLVRLGALFRETTEGPESLAQNAENAETVRCALQRLPPEQRVVVQMRIYEDKKFATIADELGWPLGTVLTRMRTALQNLRRTLRSRE